MNSLTSARFKRCYERLPKRLQRLARKNFALWKLNPWHPSLQLKEVNPQLWSARLGLDCRAVAAFNGTTYIWFWIRTQDVYLRLIASLKRRDHRQEKFDRLGRTDTAGKGPAFNPRPRAGHSC